MKDIFINLLFILLLLFLTQTFLDLKSRSYSAAAKKWVIFSSSAIAIVFVMTFSVIVNTQFVFDIRFLPFMIGSLYGGPLVSIGLYGVLVLYRFIIGFNIGLLGASINYGLLLIALIVCYPHFRRTRTRYKLLIVASLTLFHVVSSHILYYYVLQSPLADDIFWMTAVLKLSAILLIVFFLESMQRYYRLKSQLYGLEKMELVYHLSASISHEVRNGLTSAKGFVQLADEESTDPHQREYLRIATSEIDRTEAIIRDFLTFAKPALRIEKEVPLEQVITNTLQLIEPLANMYSIEIHKHVSPATIYGDTSMIQQALLNILKNSVEAMPNGGTLHVTLTDTVAEYTITITDSGIGMSSEQVARLGSPYFTTKGQKGTGLGMMVAFRIIKELRGRIKVSSHIGMGTTFTITLPKTLSALRAMIM